MVAKLNLNIRDIAADGKQIDLLLSGDELKQLLSPSGWHLGQGDSHLSVSFHARRTKGETIVVSGSIRGELWTECSRCLGSASVAVDERELRGVFLPTIKAPTALDTDIELGQDDLDVMWHDGETVDLEAFVRDSVVLAVPIAVLCSGEGCGEGLGHPSEKGGDDGGMSEPNVSSWKDQLAQLRAEIACDTTKN